jgi:SagB-type dehydrogenase family enzyme
MLIRSQVGRKGMAPSLLLSLAEDAEVSNGSGSELVVQHAGYRMVFKQLTPGILAALRRLVDQGAGEDALAELVLKTDGGEALPRLYYHLNTLDRRGLLWRSVSAPPGSSSDCAPPGLSRRSGQRLASLVPLSPRFLFPSRKLAPGRRYLLSRFAYLRRENGEAVLESPRSPARVILHDGRAATLAHAFFRPQGADELKEAAPGLPVPVTVLAAELLLSAGMLEELNEIGTCPDAEDQNLQSWEFHDLLFHARSRAGRHDGHLGGTYRFLGQLPPPAALKPPMSSDTIDLFRPDLERLSREDTPLTLVQEQRRSVRDYGSEPLSVRQLGEFLYRVGRVKELRQVELAAPGGPVAMEFAPRPYPGAGALYELELYVAVNACADLARGLYHYDPQRHCLERLAGATTDVVALLADASGSTGIAQEKLQVLLVVAARFQRIAWKYAGVAYAVILKHVGVLYQTMYLVATAMGLAPCGVGGGDSDCFARAAGTDYYAETSVGEFLLGSKPELKANKGA